MNVLVAFDANIPDERNRAIYQRCKALIETANATLVIKKSAEMPDLILNAGWVVRSRYPGRIGLFIECVKQLRLKHYDLLYFWQFPFFIYAFLIGRLFKHKGLRTCLESQHSPFYYIDAGRAKGTLGLMAGKLMVFLAKLIYKRFDIHVVMSHGTTQGLSRWLIDEFGVSQNSILASPNGVSLDIIGAESSQDSVLVDTENWFDIGYIGTISPGKGAELLEMANIIRQRVPVSRVTMAGPLRGIGVDEINNCEVSYLGVLPHSAALKLMSECDLCVFLGDGRFQDNVIAHPGKLLEYMALGRPFIAPRFEGVSGFIEVDDHLLYEPENVEEAIGLIEWHYQNRSESASIGGRLKENVKEYDWNKLNSMVLCALEEKVFE